MNRLIYTGDADTDFFVTVLMPKAGFPVAISAKRSEVSVGGSPSTDPTYSLYASNVDGEKVEFDAIADTWIDLPYTSNVYIPDFGFQYLAIEYKAGTASGTIEFYVNTPD